MEIYTGFGYDIHALVKKRAFILGGINIPHKKGFLAHSDGDVLIHALIDALLGASSLGDIGTHFPDNDSSYKNINSVVLLEKTIALLEERDLQIINIDATIICQQPKLSPYKEIIAENLASIIGIPQERISIKAKTKENMDSVGKGKAVEVMCNVLIKKTTTHNFKEIPF